MNFQSTTAKSTQAETMVGQSRYARSGGVSGAYCASTVRVGPPQGIDSRIDDVIESMNTAQKNNDIESVSEYGLLLADLDAQSETYHAMQELTGYEQGLSLMMRQLLITREYEIANQVRKYKKATGKQNVPKDVMERFRFYDESIKELNKRINGLQKEIDEQSEKLEDLSSEPEKKSIRDTSKKIADNLRKAKFTKTLSDLNKLQSNPAAPFTAVWDGAIGIIATSIEQGGMVADSIAKGIDHVKKSEWYRGLSEAAKKQAESIIKKDLSSHFSNDKNVSYPKMGKNGLTIPNSFIKQLVANGFDTIDTATKEAHRIITEELAIDGIDERQVRDAITDYGKTSKLSKADIDVKIRSLKRIGKLISAWEDARSKKRPLRSGRERDALSQKERLLKKQINEAMKDIPQTNEELENQWKTSLDSIKQRLKNRIEDLNKQIETGEKVEKRPPARLDAEAMAMKDEIERLKSIIKSIESKNELSNEQRVEMATRAIENSIAEYERRISEKDFTPHKR